MQQLEGYVIAICGAYLLTGRLVPGSSGGQALSPVYELHVNYQFDGGNFGVLRECTPVLGSHAISALPLPDGAVIVPCSELSVKERQALSNAMNTCDKLRQAMKAAESGILIAPANASVPKLEVG